MAISCAYLKKVLFNKKLKEFSNRKIIQFLIASRVIVFTAYILHSLLILLNKMPKLNVQSKINYH